MVWSVGSDQSDLRKLGSLFALDYAEANQRSMPNAEDAVRGEAKAASVLTRAEKVIETEWGLGFGQAIFESMYGGDASRSAMKRYESIARHFPGFGEKKLHSAKDALERVGGDPDAARVLIDRGEQDGKLDEDWANTLRLDIEEIAPSAKPRLSDEDIERTVENIGSSARENAYHSGYNSSQLGFVIMEASSAETIASGRKVDLAQYVPGHEYEDIELSDEDADRIRAAVTKEYASASIDAEISSIASEMWDNYLETADYSADPEDAAKAVRDMLDDHLVSEHRVDRHTGGDTLAAVRSSNRMEDYEIKFRRLHPEHKPKRRSSKKPSTSDYYRIGVYRELALARHEYRSPRSLSYADYVQLGMKRETAWRKASKKKR